MGKEKKYKFSKEEKEIIQELKNQLSYMGIPREEWSSIIQKELVRYKKAKSKSEKLKDQKGIPSFINKLKEKGQKFLFKLFSKRHLDDDLLRNQESLDKLYDMFDDSMGNLSAEEMKLMNSLFPNIPEKKVDDLGNHGTFIANRPDKKKMIVHFEDEDMED